MWKSDSEDEGCAFPPLSTPVKPQPSDARSRSPPVRSAEKLLGNRRTKQPAPAPPQALGTGAELHGAKAWHISIIVAKIAQHLVKLKLEAEIHDRLGEYPTKTRSIVNRGRHTSNTDHQLLVCSHIAQLILPSTSWESSSCLFVFAVRPSAWRSSATSRATPRRLHRNI